MFNMFKKFKKNNSGFGLIEAIVVLSLLTIFGMSMITSAMTARNRNDTLLRENIALRQGLLAVTREIRMDPETAENALDGMFHFEMNMLWRMRNGVRERVLVEHISAFESSIEAVDDDNNRVRIELVSSRVILPSGDSLSAETTIFLRTNM
jgi:hypothetical protein